MSIVKIVTTFVMSQIAVRNSNRSKRQSIIPDTLRK